MRADDVAGSSSSENGDDDKDETAERDDVNLTTPDCEHLGRTPNSDGGDDGDNDRKLTIKDNNDDDKKCDKDEAEDSEALENDTIDSDGFETEEEYTDDGEDTGSDCVEVADDSVQGSDCVKLTESSVKRSNCVKPTDNIKDGETAVKLQGLCEHDYKKKRKKVYFWAGWSVQPTVCTRSWGSILIHCWSFFFFFFAGVVEA